MVFYLDMRGSIWITDAPEGIDCQMWEDKRGAGPNVVFDDTTHHLHLNNWSRHDASPKKT